MPSSANPSMSSSSLLAKGGPSAVPCTSTKRPEDVMTTLKSTSAAESST